MSMDSYKRTAIMAAQAFHEKRFRESADLYLEAVCKAPNGVWSENRYHIFHGYTSILKERFFKATNKDLKNLRKLFIDNKDEPILFRSEAALTYGILKWVAGNREASADFYRQGLALIDQATESERRRSVHVMDPAAPMSQSLKSVGMLLDECHDNMENNLNLLESGPRVRPTGSTDPTVRLRSDGSRIPVADEGRHTVWTDPSLAPRLGTGGNFCDCCHKSREDAGMVNLLMCTRCKMAYYCSAECQKKQWKQGHREACRKKGQIEVGDVMKIYGLQKGKQFNGQVGEIIAPDETTAGRWVIRVLLVEEGIPKDISVKGENLKHIRPAA